MATILRMPEVAAGTDRAVLSDWPLAAGTSFAARDAIATVETDKATVDVPAEADGVLVRTLVEPGATVDVGAPIAVLGAPGEVVDDVEGLLARLDAGSPSDRPGRKNPDRPAERSPVKQVADRRSPGRAVGGRTPGTPAPTRDPGEPAGRIFASPLARRLARDGGLALSELTGTGPGGRIVRRDVQRAAAAPRGPAPAPAPAAAPAPEPVPGEAAGAVAAATVMDAAPDGTARDEPLTAARRAIATRLAESKRATPHFYLRGSCDATALAALRAELNATGQARISVTDLLVKAVAAAHRRHPAMNVRYLPDAIRHYDGVDVGVAIASPRGLVTPVLRSVQAASVTEVAGGIRDLADRAAAGRLRQHELEGGTITVSNLGMYGTEEFAAIINPPQSAILAVGAIRAEPVVRDGAVVAGTVLRVTLSVDHRAVDGASAAQWMATFGWLIEHPLHILA